MIVQRYQVRREVVGQLADALVSQHKTVEAGQSGLAEARKRYPRAFLWDSQQWKKIRASHSARDATAPPSAP